MRPSLQGIAIMQMLEVMRRANSEHEVRFLLSGYVETLPFYDFARSLPGSFGICRWQAARRCA